MRWKNNADKLRIIIAVVIGALLFSACDNEKLLGNDIRLFDDVSRFAEAVDNEDLDEIEKIVQQQHSLVNYQEPRFNETLLMWSILNNKESSAEKLLQLGADPNLQNYDGQSAMMYAAEWQRAPYQGDPKFLRLVLRYGGNPNAIAAPKSPPSRLATPLIAAVNSLNLENVKTVVDAGANVNYSDRCTSALTEAFNLGQIEIVRYFVIEKKADVSLRGCKTIHGEQITIFSYLEDMTFTAGSREQRMKEELVDYLEKQHKQ